MEKKNRRAGGLYPSGRSAPCCRDRRKAGERRAQPGTAAAVGPRYPGFRAVRAIGADVRGLRIFKRTASRRASARIAERTGALHGSLRLGTRLAGAAFFLAVAWMPAQRSIRAQQGPTDSEVKAAYLFNFLKFVDWPEDLNRGPQSPWVFGVLGDTPVGEDLQQLVAGKAIHGRELEVKKIATMDDLRGCHILFIGASQRKRLPAILASLHGSSVLTVADMEHFIESGGMIQFVLQDSRVRVAIDVAAASRAHLKVSSKLLSLALSVTGSDAATKD